ncbi:uncharacterized protein LOC123313387 [Coccinella septempunctata]|uniref:uncharacterized protein LOC123313387 n=1 Tax=Coccinella septempunctata TaxID=41139 RepID=UPI001D092638|nr:uncharacterized protein LOC123313387 [Coccinella septempunctata]
MNSSTLKSKPMTKEEAMRLVELVAADGVITSRATNATNNKMKEESWRRLTESFNSSVSIVPRCAQQLRLKWENLKKSARKRAANMRSSRFKTGGGKDYFPPDEVLDKVASLLGTTCEGLPTNFGGDALCEIPVVPSTSNMQEQVEQVEQVEEEQEEDRATAAEENPEIQVPPSTPSIKKNKFPLHRASGIKQTREYFLYA